MNNEDKQRITRTLSWQAMLAQAGNHGVLKTNTKARDVSWRTEKSARDLSNSDQLTSFNRRTPRLTPERN